MNWLLFALLAPALYALVVFIDKYVVSKEVKDYSCMPLYSAMTGLLSGTIVWFVTGRPLLPLPDVAIVLASGVLTALSFVFYFKAILDEDASTVNLFFQLGPIFMLVLAFFFLGEKLGIKQCVGFTIIFGAVFLASYTPTKKGKSKISKALLYILIYDSLWAISAILIKFALHANTLSQLISYQNWGVALGGLGIFSFLPSIRISFLKSLRTIKKKVILLMMFNELLFIVARVVTYVAYSLGTVTLVGLLEGTQVFYGVFYGWILTLVFPKFFNEDITKKTLFRKATLAMILFLGIIFVTL